MTAGAAAIGLVRAHYKRDEEAFASAALALARTAKLPTLQQNIRELVKKGLADRPGAQPKSSSLNQLQPRPIQTGGLLVKLPSLTFESLLLEPGLQAGLDELVQEIEYREELEARNLKPRSKLLFWGPPGNGKTSSAAALARALGTDAYCTSIPDLVSCYIGQTGNNLGKVFGSIRESSLVVFDEIDAIGSHRGGVDRGGDKEHNSIVNALLTLLDRQRTGMIVATTNRPELLDPALLRRFDERLEFPAPSVAQMCALANRLSEKFGVDRVDVRDCKNFDEDRVTYLVAHIPEEQARLRETTNAHRTAIGELQKEQRIAAQEARSRRVTREVSCERRFDFAAGMLRQVRLDTGDVIYERPLNPDERQTELFDESIDFDDAFGPDEPEEKPE